MVDELSAEYWVSLVDKLRHSSDVADVLTRHKVSLDRIQWIHGLASAGLRDAGVYIYFWKPGIGKKADVYVHGIQFVLRGMRKAKPYQGSLPHGIQWDDSMDMIEAKLAPSKLVESHGPDRFRAEFPDHGVLVHFDARRALKSVGWVTTKEIRRIQSPSAIAAIQALAS